MNTLEMFAEPADPYLGSTLRQRYRLDFQLGRGAMGAVYRAWDLERQASCAVKLLRVSGAMREAAGIRFLDEARIVARLFHPNIVEVYDHGQEPDGTQFLVMELLPGQDLEAFLKVEGRLSIEQSLDIVRQIGSALHTVHLVGVVHRDIKPRNIFLNAIDGAKGRVEVKVIDFGLAKFLDARSADRGSDGMLIGTPEYLPPESWCGVSAEVDARADQWSLAILTFRMLTGQMPFDASLDTVLLAHAIRNQPLRRVRDIDASIPEHIDAALARALSKDKNERFATTHEFVRALLRLPQPLPDIHDRETRLQVSPLSTVPEIICEETTAVVARGRLNQDTLHLTRELRRDDSQQTELTPVKTRITTVAGQFSPQRTVRPPRLLSILVMAAAVLIGAGTRPTTTTSSAAPQSELFRMNEAETTSAPSHWAPQFTPPRASVIPRTQAPRSPARPLRQSSAPGRHANLHKPLTKNMTPIIH